ncbi:MAG: hypothetical protein HQK51_04535 [Oligoflexia bacterium]|nr:hypothetical protein [Oligoflexia bacterium]
MKKFFFIIFFLLLTMNASIASSASADQKNKKTCITLLTDIQKMSKEEQIVNATNCFRESSCSMDMINEHILKPETDNEGFWEKGGHTFAGAKSYFEEFKKSTNEKIISTSNRITECKKLASMISEDDKEDKKNKENDEDKKIKKYCDWIDLRKSIFNEKSDKMSAACKEYLTNSISKTQKAKLVKTATQYKYAEKQNETKKKLVELERLLLKFKTVSLSEMIEDKTNNPSTDQKNIHFKMTKIVKFYLPMLLMNERGFRSVQISCKENKFGFQSDDVIGKSLFPESWNAKKILDACNSVRVTGIVDKTNIKIDERGVVNNFIIKGTYDDVEVSLLGNTQGKSGSISFSWNTIFPSWDQ